MIKINLLEQKKPFKVPVLLGIDITKISIKGMALAIIMIYLPDMFLTPTFESEVASIEKEKEGKRAQIKKLDEDLKGNDQIKEELAAYNTKVDELKDKSRQVDIILKTKTNPKKLLERLARNMPEDLWFETLDIDGDNNIEIKGKANTYKSIGSFMGQANESRFFNRSLNLASSKTVDDTELGQGKRVETFEIKGKIAEYDQ